jgi:CO/xanthine dehydrogenase Mo-binding subunit
MLDLMYPIGAAGRGCRPTWQTWRDETGLRVETVGQQHDALITRASDLPIHDLQIDVLPLLTPNDPPKGIAEVVMIPVVPAIPNAIYDATDRRFRSLPVTEAMIKGVLQ